MKVNKRTRAAMIDRMKWMQRWVALRRYDMGTNEQRKDLLFIYYNTVRAFMETAWAKRMLEILNAKLVQPMVAQDLAALMARSNAHKKVYTFTNEYIMEQLGITQEEAALLRIGHNLEEAKLRQQRKETKRQRNLDIQMLYMEGASVQEIAKKVDASPSTVKRVLEADRKCSKQQRNEAIWRLHAEGLSNRQIAKEVGCDPKTVGNVLSEEKGSLFLITETQKEEIVVADAFANQDAESLYSLYSVEVEKSDITEHDMVLSKLIASNENFHIIGAAGTGKTTLLNKYLDSLTHLQRKRTLVVAPTGLAAEHIKGQTIHKAFGLSSEVQSAREIAAVPDRLYDIDRVIIDEVNMVRVDVFDRVARMLKFVEKRTRRHIQVIAVGDWGQLQPVATPSDLEQLQTQYPYAEGLYAFHSAMWEQMNFQKIVLHYVYRQSDPAFVKHLSQIKYGIKEALEWFNALGGFFSDQAIYLCPTRKLVEQYNREALAHFDPTELRDFDATVSGDLQGEPPCPQHLSLAVGMRIMAITNAGSYKNGSLGTITAIRKASIRVELDNGREVTIGKKKFSLEGDVEYTQLPIVLAYAITVHKSEGCTFDEVNILPGFFVPGQLYTALSRCRTADGIFLVGELTEKDLLVDIAALKMTV